MGPRHRNNPLSPGITTTIIGEAFWFRVHLSFYSEIGSDALKLQSVQRGSCFYFLTIMKRIYDHFVHTRKQENEYFEVLGVLSNHFMSSSCEKS